ncbi:MAG: hypothetical protein Q7S88_01565 [Candidatus Daviesbacteria bacterium]|nr:hypothetical protein [Candidatus Daviesbacteria bacterium]
MSEHDSKESSKLPLTPETFVDILETRVDDVSYIPIHVQGLLSSAGNLPNGGVVGDGSDSPRYKISIKMGRSAQRTAKNTST